MSRRIDIELTSTREDGSWTWRAAGAREPRGSLSGDLLPPGTSIGDVLKVEVEGYLDGIEVVAVVPARAPRREPERLELLARREDEFVTTRLVGRRPGERRGRDRGERGRGEGEGRDRRDRRDGRDRDRRDGRDRDRDRRERRERGDRGDRGERGERGPRHERPDRPAAAAVEAKPKPKRLRPGRAHRADLLEAVAAEQRPILEQLLQGGIPAVRQAIDKQNESLKAEGKPEVNRDALLKVAEDLRPRAAAALWRDRAEAAVANVDELDLRDLRSVVNAAGDAGRDEEARALATQLREALVNRVEKEQSAWLAELADNLRESRTVRALRLSSRPPKAGAIIPADLSNQLVEQAGAALTEDTSQERWATVLDALAYSPIRRRVIPASLPSKLSPQLRETVARLGSRLPEIAHIFAIEPDELAGRPARPPRRRGSGSGPGSGGSGSGTGSGARGEGGRSSRGPRKGRGPRPERTPDAKSSPSPTEDQTTEPSAESPTEQPVEAAAEGSTEQPAEASGAGAEAGNVPTASSSSDEPTSDAASSDEPPGGAATDEPPAEPASQDAPSTEAASSDEPPAGASADEPTTEAASQDAPSTEAASSDEPSAEAGSEDEASAEAPAAESAAAEGSDAAEGEVATAESEAADNGAAPPEAVDESDESDKTASSQPEQQGPPGEESEVRETESASGTPVVEVGTPADDATSGEGPSGDEPASNSA
jgi:hypothetical protein